MSEPERNVVAEDGYQMRDEHGDTCDGCLMLSMVERAAKAEARLSLVWEALDKINALAPEGFRTGQDHLPPAFRAIDFQAAFLALGALTNEIEDVSGYLPRSTS